MTSREDDFAEELFCCSSHDIILFFTSFGKVYKLKGFEIPEGSRTSKGVNVVNILPISQNEKVTAMIRIPDFEDDKYLIMVTKNGIVKRTELSQYNTARKGGIIGINLDEDDSLSEVLLTDGSCEVIVGTKLGNAIRFKESNVRPMGRVSHGVKAIELEDGDEVVGMQQIMDNCTLLTITEKGFGKRVELCEYHTQNRGGKGLKNYKVSDKTGVVVGMTLVEDTDDLMIISSDGVIIKINVSEVPIYSRYATGVHLMRVNGDTNIVTLARTPKDDEEIECCDDGDEESKETEEQNSDSTQD
jgi:DNA gyrase subunit A